MPTRYPRIPVTKDSKLTAALEGVAPLVGRDVKTASLVHDLAILGAERLREQHERRAQAIQSLIRKSTGREGLEWDLLGRVDQEAWGVPPEAE